MTTFIPADSESIRLRLARLRDQGDEIKQLGMRVLGTAGANMYKMDLLVIGTVKRHLSTSSGFQALVEAQNLLCARALLRMQIDTALRFSAAWLVTDPNEFASKVLEGERIDKFKDKDGEKLRDAYLVEKRKQQYPWLPAVYANLSGYIHFSSAHIFDSVASLDEETRRVTFVISEKDTKFPEFSWTEVMDCFSDATDFLMNYLSGYAASKTGAK